MNFKKWLEVGMGAGGVGSGLSPVKNSFILPGAFQTYELNKKDKKDDKKNSKKNNNIN
jgi:hypothetical protein